jgi:hypothetical protein
MTNREIVEETGIPACIMSTVLYKLRQKPKRLIRIAGWLDLPYDGGTRPLAQYAIGSNADSPKPLPLGHAEVSRRCRAHKRMRVNSVFNLGSNDVKHLFPSRKSGTNGGASRG